MRPGATLRHLGLALLVLATGMARSADLPRQNPFVRPVTAQVAAAAPNGQAEAEDAAPKLLLKSMLLAGPDTVVSINGQLLRLGETIDGWRLVTARTGKAILSKGRERVELNLDDEK